MIYEYRCEGCGEVSEFQMRMSDPHPEACPRCGAVGRLKRIISKTSFALKGTGWYTTDYKKKDSSGSASGSASGASSSTKTNSSAATSTAKTEGTVKEEAVKKENASASTSSAASTASSSGSSAGSSSVGGNS